MSVRPASTEPGRGVKVGRVGHLPYIPGIDGLRACAVLAVLLYHAGAAWIPGGFLGVEVFFVISGYLITSLLLAEWRIRHQIRVAAFWLRRARRLLPAVIALILAALALATVVLPDEVARLRSDALAAATYVTNWYLIDAEQPYFESVGRPSLLRHLWSLAVEEQFYLFWPFVFAACMRLGSRRGTMAALVAGAAVSSALMAALYQPDTDPSRVYYGTDTRLAGLFIGSLLAFLWAPGSLPGHNQAPARAPDQGRALDLLGLLALAMLSYTFATWDEYQPQLYRGGFAVVGLLSAIAIAAAVDTRAGIMRRVLGWAPLRWIGLRSYGIYLWHWPVFTLTRPGLDIALDGWLLLALRLAATLALSELSYRCVEMPVRRGAWGRWWLAWGAPRHSSRFRVFQRFALVALPIVALALPLGVRVLEAEPPPVPEYLAVAEVDVGMPIGPLPAPDGVAVNPEPIPAGATPATRSPSTTFVAAANGTSTPGDYPQTPISHPTSLVGVVAPDPTDLAEAAHDPVARAATAVAVLGHVTAVGDSVMLATVGELQRVFGDVEVSAKLGRAVSAGIALLRERRDAGQLGGVVVVHLGNNGVFTAHQFDDLMSVLVSVPRVVIVNVKVPRTWQEKNNIVLADGVRRYANAVLVDWYGASADRPDLFYSDGMHLRPEGARYFADLVAAHARAPGPFGSGCRLGECQSPCVSGAEAGMCG